MVDVVELDLESLDVVIGDGGVEKDYGFLGKFWDGSIGVI